jgi:hypothetical protein
VFSFPKELVEVFQIKNVAKGHLKKSFNHKILNKS